MFPFRDTRFVANILESDICLNETNVESKLVACSDKVINELLHGFLRICSKGSLVGKKHLSDMDLEDFCFGSEACKVEKSALDSTVYIDKAFRVVSSREKRSQTVLLKGRNLVSLRF